MSNPELAARMLIQGYLRRRKMPRTLRDAVVWMVSARLQSGAQPYLTELMRSDIDQQAVPDGADPGPGAHHLRHGVANTNAGRPGDVRMLSDADLIGRYHVMHAVEQALVLPQGEGVHGAIARAASRNTTELMDIVDDLVRRVRQPGPGA